MWCSLHLKKYVSELLQENIKPGNYYLYWVVMFEGKLSESTNHNMKNIIVKLLIQ